jgi:hypothetical protein
MTLKAILSSFFCMLVMSAACTLDTKPGTGVGSLPAECADPTQACSQVGAAASGGSRGLGPGADGSSCSVDADCSGGHCSQGSCCASGDCCRSVSDCPAAESTTSSGIQLACNDPSKCQGSGGKLVCSDYRCQVLDGSDDDSGCTAQRQAKNCGLYKPVFCNGAADQQEPACATSCKKNTDCVADASCSGGRCVASGNNGSDCQKDADCPTAHCNNGVCCKSGDCCRDITGCPASYSSPAACSDPSHCMGVRKDVLCSESQCQSMEVSDAKACIGQKVTDCGNYADALCTDRAVTPICDTQCLSHSQCKAGFFCDALDSGKPGMCQPKLKDGSHCEASQQCETTCNGKVCCNDTGPNAHCCATDADCAALASSGCVEESDPTSCAGAVTTATCDVNAHRCIVKTQSDMTVCKRMIDCGPGYVSKFMCPLTCNCMQSIGVCSAGYQCNVQFGQCVLIAPR